MRKRIGQRLEQRLRQRQRASDEYYCSRCGQELPDYRYQDQFDARLMPGLMLSSDFYQGDNDASKKV